MSRARELETVLIKGLTELKGRHPSLTSFRCRGLLAMMDLGRDGKGTPIAPFNGTHPLMERFKSLLLERGIYTAIRWSHVMITPPLVISEEEIATALAAFDEALKITDEMHPSHST